MLIRFLFISLMTVVFTTGCNLIYKQNIQQGNALEQEDLDLLELGMSKRQVSFVLGSPAIRDPFHADRWDYVYTYDLRGKRYADRTVTLLFEDDRLISIDGAEPPAGSIVEEVEDTEAENTDAVAENQETEAVTEVIETPASETVTLSSFEAPTEAIEEMEPVELEDSAIESSATENSDAEDLVVEEVADATTDMADNDTADVTEVVVEEAPPVVEETDDIEATTEQVLRAAADQAVSIQDGWMVQMGAFETEANAAAMQSRLNDRGVESALNVIQDSSGKTWYRVQNGPFEFRGQAEDYIRNLADNLGIPAVIMAPESP